MMARKRAAGEDMTAGASPLARRITQSQRIANIRREARLDRQAEDMYREYRQDQRDAMEDRIARRRDEQWS